MFLARIVRDHIGGEGLSRYGWIAAVFLVLMALLVALALEPFGATTNFTAFFPAILLSAILGGFRGAVVSTLLSAISVWYFLLPPELGFGQLTRAIAFDLLVFVGNAAFVAALGFALREFSILIASSEARAVQSEARFRSYAETTSDCLWSVNAKSLRLDYLSPGFETLWGVPRETVYRDVGEWIRRIHPEDRSRVKACFDGALAGRPFEVEYRFRRGDGEWRWVNDMGVPVRDGEGVIDHISGIARDVTDRRRGEEATRASEERAKLALDAARLGSHDCDIETGQIRCDERVREIWGIGPDAVPTFDLFLRAIHPDDRDEAKEAIRAALKPDGPGMYRVTLRVIGIDTSIERWVEASGLVHFAGGKPVRLIGTVLDITAQKQAEVALRQSEARYRSLFERMSEGFGIARILRDEDGNIVDLQSVEVNPAAAKLVGVPVERILGRKVKEIFSDVRPVFYEMMDRCVREGTPISIETFSDALGKWIEFRAFRTGKDEVAILFSDVSERHRLMDDLRANEERLRLAQGAGQIGWWDWNLETGTLIWSEQHCRNWGIEPEEPASFDIFMKRLHPHDRGGVTAALDDSIRNCEPFALEFRTVAENGVERWVQARAEVFCNAEGKPTRMIGVSIDVTSLKEAESRAQDTEFRLRHLLAATTSSVWQSDSEGNFVLPQPSWAAHTGQSEKEYMGQGWLAAYHPDDRESILNVWNSAHSHGTFEHTDRLWSEAHQNYRYSLTRAVPIRDEAGRITDWIGSTTDIHDRHQAERKLRESEGRLRRLAESDVIGITMGDAAGRIIYANDAFLQMIGFSREDLEHGHINTRDITPREWWRRDKLAFGRARRAGWSPRYEKEFIRRDGSRVPVLTGYALAGDLAVGFVLDLTEQKRIENALKESEAVARLSEERFRSLAEATEDVIWVYDVEQDKIEYLNPAFEKVWGEPPDRTLADPERWSELLHPQDAEQAKSGLPRALKGEPYEIEYRIIRPDGKMRWINDSGFPMFGPDGAVRRVGGLARDVTERRRAEERQKLLLAELNHRVKNALATVQSLVVQSVRTSPDLVTFRKNFEARIIALAKTHDLLTRSHWEGAQLKDIIQEELAPYRGHASRLILQGEDVFLTPSRALSLGLVVHELATNAVKYGALSSDAGVLTIGWEKEIRDGASWLSLHWTEAGGPRVQPPSRKGFGMLLLERSVTEELQGEAEVRFESEGLRCRIAIPLS